MFAMRVHLNARSETPNHEALMNTLGSDGGDERRQENSPDAPAQIPHFREVPEGAASELTATLSRLGDAPTLDGLRNAVGTFARESRKRNIPPEQMLVALKHLLRESRAERGIASAGLGLDEHQVVEEAIADYFDAPNR